MKVIIIQSRGRNDFGLPEYALVLTDDGTADAGPALATFCTGDLAVRACAAFGWTVTHNDFAR